MRDTSRFKPYNTKAISQSIKKVLSECDIDHLTDAAYKFVTLYHSFIAHYNLHGFRATYEDDVHLFCCGLLYGEGLTTGNELNHQRYITDPWFKNEYGADYCKSISETMETICSLAKQHLASTSEVTRLRQRKEELGLAQAIANKYGKKVT